MTAWHSNAHTREDLEHAVWDTCSRALTKPITKDKHSYLERNIFPLPIWSNDPLSPRDDELDSPRESGRARAFSLHRRDSDATTGDEETHNDNGPTVLYLEKLKDLAAGKSLAIIAETHTIRDSFFAGDKQTAFRTISEIKSFGKIHQPVPPGTLAEMTRLAHSSHCKEKVDEEIFTSLLLVLAEQALPTFRDRLMACLGAGAEIASYAAGDDPPRGGLPKRVVFFAKVKSGERVRTKLQQYRTRVQGLARQSIMPKKKERCVDQGFRRASTDMVGDVGQQADGTGGGGEKGAIEKGGNEQEGEEEEEQEEEEEEEEGEDGADLHMPLKAAINSGRRKSQILSRAETVEVIAHHIERDGPGGVDALVELATLELETTATTAAKASDVGAQAGKSGGGVKFDLTTATPPEPKRRHMPLHRNSQSTTGHEHDEAKFWPLIENLGDALRCTIECDSDDAMLQSWEQVQREFKVEDCSDMDGNPGAGGRLKNNLCTEAQKPPDMLINVRFDAGGYEMVAEIQIHLRSIHRLKQMNHVLYEIVRAPSIEELRLKGKHVGTAKEGGTVDALAEVRGRLAESKSELEAVKHHSQVTLGQVKERDSEIATLKKQLMALEAVMRTTTPTPNKPTIAPLGGASTSSPIESNQRQLEPLPSSK